jgi:hypothetical protein
MDNIIPEKKMMHKQGKNFKIFYDTCDVDGLISFIDKSKTDREDRLIFISGTKAENISNDLIIDDRTKNYFAMYNEKLLAILKKNKTLLKNACEHYDINCEKTSYHISSEYIEPKLNNAWYDAGGTKVPSFTSLCVLEAEENSSIIIDNEKTEIKPGSILFFEAGRKIRYIGNIKVLSCNIAPMSMLQFQYPQKWIPIT